MNIPEERQFTLAEAETRIRPVLAQLQATTRVTSLGNGPCASLCELHASDGRWLTAGWGKGEHEAAHVGALYEAVEHLVTAQNAQEDAHILTVDELLQGLGPGLASIVPGVVLADQIEETIACRRYLPLAGSAAFDYPVLLSAPDYAEAPLEGDSFDYRPLRRYASNSGTAIGGSIDEAVLHALNECIERDALSRFLARGFFRPDAAPLRVLQAARLPEPLAALHARASALLEADICLLDISTDPGCTTCLAVAHQTYPHARPFGAGASLNPAHAARRALHELVQSHLGLDCGREAVQQGKTGSPDPRDLLAAWPRLRASAAMDIEALLDANGTTDAWIHDRRAGTVRQQVQQLAGALAQRGMRVGYHVLRGFPNGIAIVNVVVPDLDRFHLVLLGNVVVPGRHADPPASPGG